MANLWSVLVVALGCGPFVAAAVVAPTALIFTGFAWWVRRKMQQHRRHPEDFLVGIVVGYGLWLLQVLVHGGFVRT